MQTKVKIDLETGLYLDEVHPSESGDDIVETPCEESFYKPRWNGDSWEEGATQEYIDSLASEPQELPLEEKNRADIDYLAVMTGVEL